MEELKAWLENLLQQQGILKSVVPYISFLIFLVITAILIFAGVYITRIILNNTLGKVIKKTPNKWDDLLLEHKFLNRISLFVAVIILKIAVPLLFEGKEDILVLMEKLVDVYMLFVIFKVIVSLLKATEQNLSDTELYIDKPLSSYFQLLRIVLIIIIFILGLSIIIGKSPIYLLSAFGALSAVLILVFKDTILGLVASIQISANDMVRVGDWIEMPKFNADGDVLAINLNTVKVKNWDNTTTTVPTYYFVTESFKNWRGMQDSGGRRISRTLRISLNSVRFVDEETRNKFEGIELIRDYMKERQAEIEKYNAEKEVNQDVLINGRHLTNIGVFRIYILKYLESSPNIRKDMTLMVRQQTPDELGVPLQVYCFANMIGFVKYEEIQSDVFDHLFAAAPFFGLEIFQKPTGKDFMRALKE